MVIGVADQVDSLIAEHRSIERAIVQIHMPRMSVTELLQIIDNGTARLGMEIETNAKIISRRFRRAYRFTPML